MSRYYRVLIGCALLAIASGGCARARAKTVADAPPLAVPLPPPREVAASEPPPIEPTGAPFPTAAPTPPSLPAAAPAAAARPPARVAPVEADARSDGGKVEPVPPRPLRPVDPAELGRIRDLLSRAAADLARVNYLRLSSGGRSQYDQSKRFADQAEAAIKDGNLLFAETLADKAATLASALAGR